MNAMDAEQLVSDKTHVNPFETGLHQGRIPSPCTLVIFGATGDLARKKLIPALYALSLEGQLPMPFHVIATGRSASDSTSYRDQMRENVIQYGRLPFNQEAWDNFARNVEYVTIDVVSDNGLQPLVEVLDDIDTNKGGHHNHVFYLSVPPSAMGPLSRRLKEAGLSTPRQGSFSRLVVEKPFGRNLETARELNSTLHEAFAEEQIYRIDHYLGKETVQNMMVFRFANGIFEPLWNRQYIDHVQITVAESIGIEGRGEYYEESGALRDMVQSHVMQLLAITAMEAPTNFRAETIRDEKVKLLRSVRPIHPDDALQHTVRGQYGRGWVNGQEVMGYREEHGVPKGSLRETFVAARVDIDNWRWEGTPFYLRSGKRLGKRVSEIAIQFRRVPHSPFVGNIASPFGTLPDSGIEPNLLVIRIQPEEGISLKFSAKVPGQSMEIRGVNMDFHYGSSFLRQSPEAYERLLLDAMLGDTTLFARVDEVEEAWRFCTAILDGWRSHPPVESQFPNYEAGTWGPKDADLLLQRDGRAWRRL